MPIPDQAVECHEVIDVDPKMFFALLAAMAVLVIVLPWRRRKKSGNRLTHDDWLERNRTSQDYPDGRPYPDPGAIDDIAAEVSGSPTDVSTGGGD